MMLKRKARRTGPEAEAVIVVDGERVEGYEIADDPRENARQQALMESDVRLRQDHERTAFARAIRNVVKVRRESYGIVVFERVLFGGRLFIERRRWLGGQRQDRVMISFGRWVFTAKLTKGES